MYRAEIIANQSVEDDIMELLEQTIPDILFTVLPVVNGKGKKTRKLGTTIWPEQNFLLFSYIEDENIPKMKAVIAAVKKHFPGEGIKLFLVKSEE